jgi:DNA-binding CsgD family transcriptional regulator
MQRMRQVARGGQNAASRGLLDVANKAGAPLGSSLVEQEVKLFREITSALAGTTDVDPLLDRIVRGATQLCGTSIALLGLLAGDEEIEIVSAAGMSPALCGKHVPLAGGLLGIVVTSGRSVRSVDASCDRRAPRCELSLLGARGTLIVPLSGPDGVLGTLAVAKREPWRFTDPLEATLRQLAQSASIAIQTARMRLALGRATRAGRMTRPRRSHLDAVRNGGDDAIHPASTSRAAQLVSPREREILDLLAGGKTCKESAAALDISPRTVEHYVERLKLRFGQPTIPALIGYSIRQEMQAQAEQAEANEAAG